MDENLNDYEVAASISLVNIEIDSALKTSDFRYELYFDDGSSPVASGTFADLGTDTSIVLTDMTILDTGTHTYELRVWLQETGISQNNLMNKSFSAKIKVASAYSK